LLADRKYARTSIRPGHVLEVGDIDLLTDSQRKLLDVKFKVLISKREASLEAVDSLV
jgi:hypothetical protein